MRGTRLDHLQELAEELIKENPEETIIKAHMKAAGLRYTDDPVARLNEVLSMLDHARTPETGSAGRAHAKGSAHGKDL